MNGKTEKGEMLTDGRDTVKSVLRNYLTKTKIIPYNYFDGEIMTAKDIKEIRTKLLLLQNEFADELGVSLSTVQCWEQGRRHISIKSQRKVLEYCKKKGVL